MDILNNQQLIIGLVSLVIVAAVQMIWKKNIDKAQIIAILTAIWDVVQDVANNPATATLDNFSKKTLAVQRVEANLTVKKTTLVKKVFGTVGGAVEYVYNNRKWLFGAANKLVRAVF